MNAFLFLLLACGDKANDTAESNDETDTGSETIPGTPVTVALSNATGMKIGLVQVVFPQEGESEDGAPQFVDPTVISGELDAETSFTFGVETPEESDLSEIDPESTALLGLWAPFLFEDSNGDDAYTDGETISGFGNTWLVYTTEDISEINVTEGWNALEMTFTEEPPITGDLTNIPLEANLKPVETLSIGGSYNADLGERRIAVLASATFENSTIETMADEVASDPWRLSFSGTPPESQFPSEEEGVRMAVGAAFVYRDSNGSGAFEVDDLYGSSEEIFTICYDSGTELQPISIVYSPSASDFQTAMYSGMVGLNAGWSALTTLDSDPVRITGADLENLVINEYCVMSE
jgi:hypothetical protein